MSSSVSHHGQPSCHHQHRPSCGGQHQDGQTHGNHSLQPIPHPYFHYIWRSLSRRWWPTRPQVRPTSGTWCRLCTSRLNNLSKKCVSNANVAGYRSAGDMRGGGGGWRHQQRGSVAHPGQPSHSWTVFMIIFQHNYLHYITKYMKSEECFQILLSNLPFIWLSHHWRIYSGSL